MKFIESINEMREYSRQLKRDGKTIACVTTTGYLHDGHMSLVKIAKENADVVVMNTNAMAYLLRFSQEWSKNYKKDLIEAEVQYQQESLKNDLEICKKHKIDVFFHPSMLDYYLYPIQTITISHAINKRLLDNPVLFANQGETVTWCLDLDTKIWNSILPDIIVEGQKDIQQSTLMKFYLNYFHYPIKIIIAPTLRDSDGLAFSSRNVRLTQSERHDATSIYQSLQDVSAWPLTILSIQRIKRCINECITRNNGTIYYVDICCAETLEELDVIDRKFVIIVTAKFGEVVVWDNIIIEPK